MRSLRHLLASVHIKGAHPNVYTMELQTFRYYNPNTHSAQLLMVTVMAFNVQNLFLDFGAAISPDGMGYLVPDPQS